MDSVVLGQRKSVILFTLAQKLILSTVEKKKKSIQLYIKHVKQCITEDEENQIFKSQDITNTNHSKAILFWLH